MECISIILVSSSEGTNPDTFYSPLTCTQLNYKDHYLTILILITKPTRCTNSQINFWNRTLHVSDRCSVHHQESSTVYAAIGICHTGYADCLLAGSVSITCMTYTYCCVYSTRLLMMDRASVRNM